MDLRRVVVLIGVLSLIFSSVGFLQGDARPLGDFLWFSAPENFVHVTLGVVMFAAGISVPERSQKWVVLAFGLLALAYGAATVVLYMTMNKLITSPGDLALHLVLGFGALALAFNARSGRGVYA